jgi:hypothetical protein
MWGSLAIKCACELQTGLRFLPPHLRRSSLGEIVSFTDLSFRSLCDLAVTPIEIEISPAAYAAPAGSSTRGLLEPRRSPEGGLFYLAGPEGLKTPRRHQAAV